jgi:hypothetical protein
MGKNLQAPWFTLEELINNYPPDYGVSIVLAIEMLVSQGIVEEQNGFYRVKVTEEEMLRLMGYSFIGNPN